MKATKIIIATLLITIMANFVSASGFSPTSLIFNLSPNEKSCQTITVTSDSEKIIINDGWAENKNVEWKVSLFNGTAGYHKLTISYPKELTSQRTAEVCLSGEKTGEYHGVILIKEAQVGNSIIQMGVWVKATISGTPASPTSTSASSSGGSGTSTTSTTPTNNTTQTQTQKSNEEEQTTTAGSNPITGAVVGTNESNKMKTAVFFIAGICGMMIAVTAYKTWRKIKWERGF